MNVTNETSPPTTSNPPSSEPHPDQIQLQERLQNASEEIGVLKMRIFRGGAVEVTMLRGHVIPLGVAQLAFNRALGQLNMINLSNQAARLAARSKEK